MLFALVRKEEPSSVIREEERAGKDRMMCLWMQIVLTMSPLPPRFHPASTICCPDGPVYQHPTTYKLFLLLLSMDSQIHRRQEEVGGAHRIDEGGETHRSH